MKNKKVKIWMALLMGALSVSAANTVAPVELRCEYLQNPLGIDVVQPRLSWRLEAETRGQKQNAYRILVASSAEKLKQNQGDLWDTGKIQSSLTTQIAYAGKTLSTHMPCFWKVMAWDVGGTPSDWSKPAHWTMGLLNSSDWKAEWIGFDKGAKSASGAPEIVITKAFYGVEGNPEQQVDLTAKLQAKVDSGATKINSNDALAGKDLAPGKKKILLVNFTRDGNPVTVKVLEGKKTNLLNHKSTVKSYLPAPYLRKEFKLNGKVARATLYATAQGFLEMHLNGKRISDEYFMPGWTDYRKRIYYRTYDVTSMLEPGANALGAILGDGWFRGNISKLGQNQYGSLIRLKAQLQIDYADGRSELIASDPSWKAAFGPILESDMQAGETYDARKEISGWNRPGFDASNWSSVNVGSALSGKPLIQAYPGVPVRKTQELPALTLNEPKPGNFVFDLGQNFSGWIRLKVKGKAGEKIVMRFGEMLSPDGTVYTENLRTARVIDTYICKGGGEEVWEPRFTFHGFQYVEVTGVSAKPTLETVTGIAVHSDAPMTGSFECSNPMLNKLFSNILWGQRSNYLDVPTDCPQRDERLGWTGDTQVFIRSGSYNQDVAAFFTKWNVDLMDTQNEAGLFGRQAPVFHGYGSPGWEDAGVICPWTIYQVYGDVRMIRQYYDQMARFIEYLPERTVGYGDWHSIGAQTPKDLILTVYSAYSTSLMIKTADALGKKEDAAKYRQLFEELKAEFQKKYVQEDGKIAGDTQTAYCMGLYYDLLTEKQREQAVGHLLERLKVKEYHLSVGFLGAPILLPTLTEIGRNDLAYRLIQNKTYPSWGYSVEQGATTIWERWNSYTKDKGFKSPNMNSFNHYAYGACVEWMYRSMLGIDTDGIAFKKIKMKPEFDESVPWAKGHYDSIHGRIASDWKWSDGTFEWKVTIPPNTTATAYMPENAASLTESGKPIAKANGVKFLRTEKGRAVYELQSGAYFFKKN